MSEAFRAELAAIEPARECCRAAELSGLAMAAANEVAGDGDEPLTLDVVAAGIARRAFLLLRSFGVGSTVEPYQRPAFEQETRYVVRVSAEPRTLQALEEAGIVDARLRRLPVPPKRLVRRSCCRAALIRGTMLGRGSVSGPRDPHLEVRVHTEGQAAWLAGVAAAAGLRVSTLARRGHVAVYAKGVEAVSDAMALAGAHESALELREATVLATTRAQANRLANADHANLVRASRSAQSQIRAIRRLESTGALAELPPELVEIAELRLAHPSLSLRELAERCDPPTGKATAHRRLRRLEQLGGVSPTGGGTALVPG